MMSTDAHQCESRRLISFLHRLHFNSTGFGASIVSLYIIYTRRSYQVSKQSRRTRRDVISLTFEMIFVGEWRHRTSYFQSRTSGRVRSHTLPDVACGNYTQKFIDDEV